MCGHWSTGNLSVHLLVPQCRNHLFMQPVLWAVGVFVESIREWQVAFGPVAVLAAIDGKP